MSGRVLELCEKILAVESVTGNEQELCDWIAGHLHGRGVELLRAGDNLWFVPRALDAGKRTLALVGHIDTVPGFGPNPVRREGDKLYGLGASDMKAACAVMLALGEEAAQKPPHHNLVCVFYAKEEGPFAASGMPEILAAAGERLRGVDLAICMEPTNNALELGCMGTLHAKVTFSGKRAHSARPWQGENAIHKAAGFLAVLNGLQPREVCFGGLSFYEVLSATMVEFRGARNVIPDRFTLNVNYRFAPGKDLEMAQRDVLGLVGGVAEVEFTDLCPAGKVCGENVVLRDLESSVGALPRKAKQAWTDVGRLSHLGVDAVNFGPGLTAQAHQDGEYVLVGDVVWCWEKLRGWLFG
jgi:succinyl-diaminopimelate desuccinylase